jgi:BirA family biotin operon repressor/biotin-[acetyl-CoA-carboxylase] ligase
MSIHLHELEETTSTNDVARRLALAGAPHGTLVSASRQLGGRGRLGRHWWSPPEGAVAMSLVLRPTVPVERLAATALVAGLAAAETLEGLGVPARLKWPNDLLVGGLKVGGILSELIEDDGGQRIIIVGLGLNADFEADRLPVELHGLATTLRSACKRRYDPRSLVRVVGEAIVERFARFEVDGLDVAAIVARCDTVGARVADEGGRQGTALGIAGSGALQVLWDGAPGPADVVAGDVVRVAATGRT